MSELEYKNYNDYSNKGKLTSKNDLLVIGGNESLFQSIKRELDHYLGSVSYMDSDYGSQLIDYTGYLSPVANDLIELEIERIVMKYNDRVSTLDINSSNNIFNLKITTVDGDTLDYNYNTGDL